MNKFLSMLENPRPETVVEEENLRYFISKIFIWDYFNISESTYKSYSVDEKSRLFHKYYSELYQKYYESGDFYFLFLFGLLLIGIFCLCLAMLCVIIKEIFRFVTRYLH